MASVSRCIERAFYVLIRNSMAYVSRCIKRAFHVLIHQTLERMKVPEKYSSLLVDRDAENLKYKQLLGNFLGLECMKSQASRCNEMILVDTSTRKQSTPCFWKAIIYLPLLHAVEELWQHQQSCTQLHHEEGYPTCTRFIEMWHL